MDLGLKNKNFLIAAASEGLGFGIAQEAVAEGASVSICGRSKDKLIKATDELKALSPSKIKSYPADMSSSVSINQWVDDTIKDFGTIHGLVVNAGGPPAGNFESFADDTEWQKAFELTLMSAVRLIRAVLPEMKKNGGGSIVVLTSSSIKEPIDNLILSNVFRSGVTSLAKSLSLDLAKYGIRVNNLVPGRIDTARVKALDQITSEKKGIPLAEVKKAMQDKIPLGRYGTIEEFGKAGVFLLSDAASYITGETFIVDGGSTRTVW